MPKINLGERFDEPTTISSEKKKKKEIFFPSLHVSEKIPKGFEVGQSINGTFNGKIVAVSESSTQSKDRASFTIDVMSIDMKKGKISDKEFEGLSDKDQEKELEKNRE